MIHDNYTPRYSRRTLVRAEYDFMQQRVKLYMFDRGEDGNVLAAAQPILFQEQKNDGDLIQPCALLTEEQAQQLMDSLWDCGIRPTDGAGSAGAMAAVKEHLKDLQRIVFRNYREDNQ